MEKYSPSRELILDVLSSGKPRSCMEMVRATGLTRSQVGNLLVLAWRRGLILRTAEPVYETERISRGRAGTSHHARPYHLYLLRPRGEGAVALGGRRFVAFSKEYLDPRGDGSVSKSSRVADFLRSHPGKAFYSKDVAARLVGEGVGIRDVMTNVRRFERKGLVYVRGYKMDDRQTPFKEGYLITWLSPEKPRQEAIEEAVHKSDKVLADRVSSSPFMERVQRIRDMIIEHSTLRKLVGFSYIHNKLGCSLHEVEGAVGRSLQLHPDLREVKLFGAYRYYYHDSLAEEDLNVAVEMKKNYIAWQKAGLIG